MKASHEIIILRPHKKALIKLYDIKMGRSLSQEIRGFSRNLKYWINDRKPEKLLIMSWELLIKLIVRVFWMVNKNGNSSQKAKSFA